MKFFTLVLYTSLAFLREPSTYSESLFNEVDKMFAPTQFINFAEAEEYRPATLFRSVRSEVEQQKFIMSKPPVGEKNADVKELSGDGEFSIEAHCLRLYNGRSKVIDIDELTDKTSI